MRPPDLPSIEKWPHGVRARYVSGCRCDLCRKANREYAHRRAVRQIFGDWNGLVSAARARNHLMKLSAAGIGRRTVQMQCGVGNTALQEIKTGKKTQIRARTERKILSVKLDRSIARGTTNIPARDTWAMIRHLLDEGFSKAELARRLGYVRPALQLNTERVTAVNAAKVRRFYRVIMAGA